MAPIAKSDLDAITTTIASAVSTAIAQAFAAQSQPAPKAAAMPAQVKTQRYTGFLPKGAKADAASLQAKDQRIFNAFTKRGYSPVILRDRANPSADHNVKPFKLWLDDGRVVRKGQKGVMGFFHLLQTDALPKPAKAKGKKS